MLISNHILFRILSHSRYYLPLPSPPFHYPSLLSSFPLLQGYWDQSSPYGGNYGGGMVPPGPSPTPVHPIPSPHAVHQPGSIIDNMGVRVKVEVGGGCSPQMTSPESMIGPGDSPQVS